MNLRAYLFAAALTAFVVVLIAVAAFFHRKAQRAAGDSYEALLNRLSAVDRYKIALIASDVLPSARPHVVPHAELEPEEIWELIGGMAGLEALEANCDVLIALACHVQRVYPEALPVAEQLRLNAREFQWHLGRLRDSERAESLHVAFPNYAQRAVSTYYVMTQSVLALYEGARLPEYLDLQKAM